MRIALVSCVKQKQPTACAAKDIYISPLFQKARAYAERNCDDWRILSAKYGLLRPDRRIEPYELTLKEYSAAERRLWAARSFEQLREHGLLTPSTEFLWLAGFAYRRDLAVLLRGFQQRDPLEGMRIGERLRWLNTHSW